MLNAPTSAELKANGPAASIPAPTISSVEPIHPLAFFLLRMFPKEKLRDDLTAIFGLDAQDSETIAAIQDEASTAKVPLVSVPQDELERQYARLKTCNLTQLVTWINGDNGDSVNAADITDFLTETSAETAAGATPPADEKSDATDTDNQFESSSLSSHDSASSAESTRSIPYSSAAAAGTAYIGGDDTKQAVVKSQEEAAPAAATTATEDAKEEQAVTKVQEEERVALEPMLQGFITWKKEVIVPHGFPLNDCINFAVQTAMWFRDEVKLESSSDDKFGELNTLAALTKEFRQTIATPKAITGSTAAGELSNMPVEGEFSDSARVVLAKQFKLLFDNQFWPKHRPKTDIPKIFIQNLKDLTANVFLLLVKDDTSNPQSVATLKTGLAHSSQSPESVHALIEVLSPLHDPSGTKIHTFQHDIDFVRANAAEIPADNPRSQQWAAILPTITQYVRDGSFNMAVTNQNSLLALTTPLSDRIPRQATIIAEVTQLQKLCRGFADLGMKPEARDFLAAYNTSDELKLQRAFMAISNDQIASEIFRLFRTDLSTQFKAWQQWQEIAALMAKVQPFCLELQRAEKPLPDDKTEDQKKAQPADKAKDPKELQSANKAADHGLPSIDGALAPKTPAKKNRVAELKMNAALQTAQAAFFGLMATEPFKTTFKAEFGVYVSTKNLSADISTIVYELASTSLVKVKELNTKLKALSEAVKMSGAYQPLAKLTKSVVSNTVLDAAAKPAADASTKPKPSHVAFSARGRSRGVLPFKRTVAVPLPTEDDHKRLTAAVSQPHATSSTSRSRSSSISARGESSEKRKLRRSGMGIHKGKNGGAYCTMAAPVSKEMTAFIGKVLQRERQPKLAALAVSAQLAALVVSADAAPVTRQVRAPDRTDSLPGQVPAGTTDTTGVTRAATSSPASVLQTLSSRSAPQPAALQAAPGCAIVGTHLAISGELATAPVVAAGVAVTLQQVGGPTNPAYTSLAMFGQSPSPNNALAQSQSGAISVVVSSKPVEPLCPDSVKTIFENYHNEFNKRVGKGFFWDKSRATKADEIVKLWADGKPPTLATVRAAVQKHLEYAQNNKGWTEYLCCCFASSKFLAACDEALEAMSPTTADANTLANR